MDQADIVITSVKALKIPLVEVTTSDGHKYTADLSDFKPVNCFPVNQQEWNSVSLTTHGFNLTWSCRFEVHLDQVVDRATSVETLKKHA